MNLKKLSFLFLSFLYLSFIPHHAAIALPNHEVATEEINYVEGIDSSILLLSAHDEKLYNGLNSVFGSAYQLLNQAEHSILIINYAYENSVILEILNRKAAEGLNITVVYDRDRGANLSTLLHPAIKNITRTVGDGHLHHKIIVVDREYNWISSANFNSPSDKNIALACRNQGIAETLYKECFHIETHQPRLSADVFSTIIDSQRLEFYILPYNDPNYPRVIESLMNEYAKVKLLSLINEAKKSIRVSMVVWTYKDSARALVQAAQRGVKVEVVYANIDKEVLNILRSEKIDLRRAIGLFHHKFMEIDDSIIWNGSANWSMNAFSRTDDSVTVLYDLKPEQVVLMNDAWQDLRNASVLG